MPKATSLPTCYLYNADIKAAFQAPETYALQQQLFFKGTGNAQHSMFSCHDASGTGRLPLEDLTRCCQAISPGKSVWSTQLDI